MVEKCLSFAPEHRECAALLKQLAPQPPLGDLIAEIDAERKARNFDRAVSLGEKCIRAYPQAATCYRQLGSNYAALATRDQSATDMEKAKKYYQRFLEVAPPDDEYVPKVKAVLGQAEDGAASPRNQTAPLTQIFELAMRLKEKNPTEAARYFQLVAESGEAPPALAEQARQELAALRPQADARDTYQRGYQLRESDPGEAARLFKDVMAQTSPDSELHQKAKTRLAELTPSADAPASVAVKLEVGHQKVLNFPGMVRVAVGDPNVVEVKTIGSSQLLLIGASVGSTTLQVWMSSGERASHLVTVSK
jgi:tetratricopeptide (TPR) repeat protein